MAGIGIVINPRSGHNLRDPRAASRLARALGDHGVVRTARTRDDLPRIAEDFRRLHIDILGISGGDGTNQVTLTGFLSVYDDEPLPPLAFLRGGTMNTVANSVGVPRGKPDGLLAAVIKRYAERDRMPLHCAERYVMRVGDHHGFLFGTGAIYGFMDEYFKTDKPNPVWAARVLAQATASVFVGGDLSKRVARRWEGKVTFGDGDEFPDRDYFSIGAGTVDQIGLGFRPFYRCHETPGRFHILGIHTSRGGFVGRLPNIWRARPMGDAHTYEKLTDRAVLEARSGLVEYMCDGDLFVHKGPLELSVGPKVKILIQHKPGVRS